MPPKDEAVVTSAPAKPAPAPKVEPGVSLVQYRAGKDPKVKVRPGVQQAVVVKVEGSRCSLKVLGVEGGTTLVEGVEYSADETDKPRWF